MPNIREFDAPKDQLHPDDKGFAAFETMGRRVGPLYNQAGQDVAKIGRLHAQEIQDRRWPYNIMALQQSGGGGGVNFRVVGSRGGGGGGGGRVGAVPRYRSMNEVARGAPLLARMARGAARGEDGIPADAEWDQPDTDFYLQPKGMKNGLNPLARENPQLGSGQKEAQDWYNNLGEYIEGYNKGGQPLMIEGSGYGAQPAQSWSDWASGLVNTFTNWAGGGGGQGAEADISSYDSGNEGPSY